MNGRSWHFSAASFVMDNMTACFERLITASKIAQQYVLETCESQGLVYIFGERFPRQKVALDASERNFKVPLKAKRIHCTLHNHTEFFQVYWMPLKLNIQNYTFSFIFLYSFVCILQYAKFSLVNTLWVFCKMRGMIGSQIPDLNCYFSLSPARIRSTYL